MSETVKSFSTNPEHEEENQLFSKHKRSGINELDVENSIKTL
jgi:hypothetical protein